MALGMTLSFALFGVVIGLFGNALGLSPDKVRTFAAVMLIVFGISMVIPQLNERLTNLISPLASSAHQASASLDNASLKGSFLLGGLLGLIWSPCSGPLLGTALTLVATEGGAARGGLILGLFGAGAAIPLVGVAYLSRAGFSRIQSWVVVHADQTKVILGGVLLLIGLAILSGGDRWVESQINNWLPDAWLELTVHL
jgi:cytochrome c biogenesis protein CcdA